MVANKGVLHCRHRWYENDCLMADVHASQLALRYHKPETKLVMENSQEVAVTLLSSTLVQMTYKVLFFILFSTLEDKVILLFQFFFLLL